MNIGINVSFLRKSGTGIGQVTTHFLSQLMRSVHDDPSMKEHTFFLYCEDELVMDIPENFVVRAFLPWYKRDDLFRKLIWEKYCLPCRARRDRCDLLISLYQSATMIKYIDMRHVMIVHDIIPEIFPEYVNNMRKKHYWRQVRKGIYSAQSIIAVSEHTKSDLESRLNVKAAKISVAPIAVDPIFSQELADGERERVMQKYGIEPHRYIYAAGLEMRKNIDRTMRAYALLRQRDLIVPDLVISGTLMPHLAPLIIDVQKLAQELDIAEHVKAIGFVEQKDLPALYACATMFIFPSLYEGFGMPVLEAMHMGTPVITTRDTSIPEVGGEAVVYVGHDDHELCDAMGELLCNHDRRTHLRDQGIARARSFSWDDFYQRIREAGSF